VLKRKGLNVIGLLGVLLALAAIPSCLLFGPAALAPMIFGLLLVLVGRSHSPRWFALRRLRTDDYKRLAIPPGSGALMTPGIAKLLWSVVWLALLVGGLAIARERYREWQRLRLLDQRLTREHEETERAEKVTGSTAEPKALPPPAPREKPDGTIKALHDNPKPYVGRTLIVRGYLVGAALCDRPCGDPEATTVVVYDPKEILPSEGKARVKIRVESADRFVALDVHDGTDR
jgi:hypothetical protein